MQLIKWPWLIGIAIVIGVVAGFMGGDPGQVNERVSLKPLVWVFYGAVVIQLINLAYTVYVVKHMKNHAKIERRLKQAGNPYFRMIYYMVNGDLETAAQEQKEVKGKQMQLMTKVQLALESRDMVEAERIADQIKHSNIRYYSKALIAIYKRDWDDFEAQKEQLKQQVLIHALEAEAAFRRGELEKADKHGNLAIEGAAGVQHYILIKSRDRQEKNHGRVTYF
ncbi:hypothetical protein OIN60_16025 [Paenibacillus sp. P96]|uniref:Uncharacterized protein n=1 Tax=Paenibacillus zeirhizosphaerae TaxID=2987519 RepID=A0ABT9FU80_9BACL|nr:hypothetical protein [Paenibacillus sp. P96]MDP4098266.1 hypothetical protein [Paenibacillus sp. P96]